MTKNILKKNIYIFKKTLKEIFLILIIGTLGYKIYGKLKWIDSFHNASMVLTATSLITLVDSYEGKIFSSFYNLLTGIFVLVIIGVVIRKALSEMGISNTGLGTDKNTDKKHR